MVESTCLLHVQEDYGACTEAVHRGHECEREHDGVDDLHASGEGSCVEQGRVGAEVGHEVHDLHPTEQAESIPSGNPSTTTMQERKIGRRQL